VPIDRAVTYARRQILSIPATGEGVDKSRLENSWPLVRLTLHGQADHTIEMHCQCPRPRIWMDRHFVARWNERWDAWRAIDGTHSRLAVIGGPKKAGRTELLNCVAEICAHDGDAVVMVDLSTGPSGGWPDVLRAVASAADDHPDVDAATLTTIAAGDGERETVIGHFLTALETCSPGRRLVVAIDGLEDWSEDLVKQMIGDLCEPLVLPKAASNVRLVITLKSPLDNVDFGLDRAIWEPVTVGEFPEDEWARALPRYLDGLTDDEDARSKLEALVAGNLVVFGRSATTLEYARYGAKQLSRGQP
jgi:hypothetical protein